MIERPEYAESLGAYGWVTPTPYGRLAEMMIYPDDPSIGMEAAMPLIAQAWGMADGTLPAPDSATVSIDVGRCVICLAGEDLSLSSFGADWMTAAETMGFVFVRLAPKPVQSLRVAHLLIARSGRRRGVLWNATALVTA